MHIGLDFDNTIVSYDSLFHKVAREQGHIPESVAANKNAVRDYLRSAGKEPVWTEMQGYVYGARMNEAEAYDGAIDVLKALKGEGHRLFIISHKTKTPYAGPAYDLHAAARGWIDTHLPGIIPQADAYFHETKDEKVARIGERQCDIFLDDLPEILSHQQFPAQVKRVLFSTTKPERNDWLHAPHWRDFAELVRHG